MPKNEEVKTLTVVLTSVVMTEKRNVFGKFVDTLASSMEGLHLADLGPEGVRVTSELHPYKEVVLSPAGIALKVFTRHVEVGK